jgi:hypothetical protein
MKKGMFTIEVLISIFILFLVVSLSATSSKFLNQMLKQQNRYKELYSVVFSIKDKISKDICTQHQRMSGEVSGLEYVAHCTLIKESQGLVKNYDFDENKYSIGYTGSYRFHLYEVELEIVKHHYSINYYINRYDKVVKL